YRGMDIGTAKPTRADQERIRHHVIDVWEPTHEVSVVEFRDEARRALASVVAAGATPVVVGGSWLYVQAIVDDFQFPPTDPIVRARWEQRLASEGAVALHIELTRLDPTAAQSILPSNGRRIVRALEVVELQGGFTSSLPEPTSWCPTRWYGIDVDRSVLDSRIRNRVEQMWAAGWLGEVAALVESGFGRTAERALGYSQITAHLAGRSTQEQAMEATVVATQRFARRQQRRFRQDRRITWLDGDEDAMKLAEQVVQDTAT
ncbi:MAG: tRNA (adenosine(37)-N6)-dimethylallyltransferase MiaA, partial [Actinomycetes bacterium]